jgi:hypothetical protein
MELTHVIANANFNIWNPSDKMHFFNVFHLHTFGKQIFINNKNAPINA